MIGLKTIEPHETVHIDVKNLRDEQTPDERGNRIPPYISSGQLQWTLQRKDNLPDDDVRANLALIGRSEQVDIAKGIVNNYSCQNCCAGTHSYGYITPSSAEIEYGETAHFIAIEAEETCYGFPYEFSIGASWSSSDTGIGTISGGDITAVGVGQTSIGASWSTHFAFSEPCPPGGDPLAFDKIASYQADKSSECSEDGKRRGGPSVNESREIDPPNPSMLSPECGTCEFYGFTFGAPAAALTVKPKVQKIQYQEPGTSNYVDVVNTLYVLKGTTVNFKAVPDPPNATFPNGQPIWSGTSGTTGTGQTKSVTFNTKSNSTTDYKTVIASVISPVVVNVVVYELTGTLNPQDSFYGRSTGRYGLLEKANLGFIASPNVTAQQIGTLRWAIQQGLGSVSNDTNLNGAGIFTVDRNVGTVQLVLNIENGPSKGVGFLPDLLTVVAPTGAYMVKNPGVPVLHCQNYSSVGFQGFVYLNPKDVSFSNLYFQEGFGTIQAQGYYQNQNGLTHDPTGIGIPISSCNIITGCEAFYDTVYTLNWTGPFGPGTLTWPIEWKYGFSDSDRIQNYVLFTEGVHSSAADNQGTATISKAGSGSFTKMVSESTSGNASLNPCIYPVVSP